MRPSHRMKENRGDTVGKHIFDDRKTEAALTELAKNPMITVTTLGKSILGRELPLIRLGKGEHAVLYVGGIRGTEGVISSLLIDFALDYKRQQEKNATVFDYPMRYLAAERSIYLVPMLDPDGISYVTNGIGADNPLRERVLRMNGGSEELSAWQANARGVDLCHNFDAGFLENKQREAENGIRGGAPGGYGGEYPESEPETAALCRFLRGDREAIRGVLSLQCGGGAIYCDCDDNLTAKTMSVGRVLSRFTGYQLVRPEQISSIGSLSDWCIRALCRPAFTVKCDLEAQQYAAVYERLRRMLFSFSCIV